MAASCLIVSRDPATLGSLRGLLEDMSIQAEVCLGPESARATLRRQRYSPVIVDCDEIPEALELLRESREGQGVSVGIVGGFSAMQTVLGEGVDYVMSKPVLEADARRIVLAACGMLNRMVRRFFRIPVDSLTPVTLRGFAADSVLVEVSEGGVAVQSFHPLQVGRSLHLHFKLPGTEHAIETVGQVAWTNGEGRAGIRFVELPESAHQHLKQWLAERASAAALEFTPNLNVQNPAFEPMPESPYVAALAADAVVVLAACAVLLGLIYGLTGMDALREVSPVIAGLLLFLFFLLYRQLFALERVPTAGEWIVRRVGL